MPGIFSATRTYDPRSTMELRPASIVILDISGYTKFIRMHRLAVLHAEHIINDLLEHAIAATGAPLVVNKLQGDAVLMYAVADDHAPAARAIVEMVTRSFDAFRRRELELVSDCKLCPCSACTSVQNLRLKAILHHGDVVFKRMRQFEEIAGQEVIVAHRLLKNSIEADEYILATDAFDRLLGGAIPGHRREARQEQCEGIGPVAVAAYFAQGAAPVAPPRRTLLQRVGMSLSMDMHLLKRIFHRPEGFENLRAAQGGR